MERASVTRLYKDRQSREAVLLLEGVSTKREYKITVPDYRAAVLALEGHGLNDRCTLYGVLSECVGRLGGAFASVVVSLDRSRGVSGTVALVKNGDVSRVRADAVELVAFALHVQLPIYVEFVDETPSQGTSGGTSSRVSESGIPQVFEQALTDILGHSHDSSAPVRERPEQGRESGAGDGAA